jgi:hypothetical protein
MRELISGKVDERMFMRGALASGAMRREKAEVYLLVIASVAKQSIYPRVDIWIASLRSQ